MNKATTQMIALIGAVNTALCGVKGFKFLHDAYAWANCTSISFIEFNGPIVLFMTQTILAENPDLWFRWLTEQGVLGLRLRAKVENKTLSIKQQSTAPSKNTIWRIEAIMKNGKSQFWSCRWIENNNAAESLEKNFSVEYALFEVSRTEVLNLPKIDDLKSKLRSSLIEISSFVETQNWGEEYSARFADALNALNYSDPQQDLLHSEAMPGEASCLLNAAKIVPDFDEFVLPANITLADDLRIHYEQLYELLALICNESITVVIAQSMPKLSREETTPCK